MSYRSVQLVSDQLEDHVTMYTTVFFNNTALISIVLN